MSSKFIPSKNVEVPEFNFEKKITLAAKKTVLIIVDMQNDFVKDAGTLVVPDAAETIPNIRGLINSVKKSGVKVVYTQDTHFKDDKEWKIWPEHCKKDSWGWNIVDELLPRNEDLVFQKNRYDGFYGTTLDHYLSKVWKIENLIIVGTVSNICVAHTAASAGLRWYNIIVPANGISALTEFDQASALRQITSLYLGKLVKSVDDIKFSRGIN